MAIKVANIGQLKTILYKFAYMNTIRVSTTQHIDIDYDVAGFGERFAAWAIDAGMFFVLYLLGVFSAVLLADSGAQEVGVILVIVIYALLYVFYDLVCEVFFNGQSVGKRAMKIKVISLDGRQPSVSQYLLRWVFRIVDFLLTSGLGALISVAASPKKQRIGDIVANTAVIKTTPRTPLTAIAFRPMAEAGYEPQFPEVGQLADRDLELVHEVLENYRKSGNPLLVQQLANKLKAHLGLSIPQGMDDLQFLHAVVKDYNFITAADN